MEGIEAQELIDGGRFCHQQKYGKLGKSKKEEEREGRAEAEEFRIQLSL